MDAVGTHQNVASRRRPVRAVAAKEVTGDAAFVLRERAKPVSAMHTGVAKPRAHRLIDHCLQTATMDRELRILETGIGAAWLAPDLLANAVHIEELVGPDSDLIKAWEQA